MVSDKKEWEVKRIRGGNGEQYLIQRPWTWVNKKDVHADKEVQKFRARRQRREAVMIRK
jgi:hypothetical protein